MLVNASAVLELIRMYRVVWIKGRYGGGKTALAHRIAYELLEGGHARYLLSNCRSVWRDDLGEVMPEGSYLDTVIILDEGGLFLRTGRDAEEFLAFCRKFNITIIIPSVQPPSSRVRSLSIQRVYNLQAVGLPLWVYKASLRYDEITEAYWFAWAGPSEIFGVYDTGDVPVDDAGISDFLLEHKERVVNDAGQGQHRKNAFQSVAVGWGDDASSGPVAGDTHTADVLAEVADQIGGIVPLLERAGQQRGKKRR